MPRLDLVVETPASQSIRAKQLSGMFDVPSQPVSRLTWSLDAPIEDRHWSIGLITGPSGAGKSTMARAMFGDLVDAPLEWGSSAVVDDFAESVSISDLSQACQAVGFNTIPAWLRPFGVLSNGEKFRVELARRLVEGAGSTVVVDEFTSVVDRQVARIGSHAVQKYVRRGGGRFVAVTCHEDVEEWLQPDWVIEAPSVFRWRSVQPRPTIEVEVGRLPFEAWETFAPFHYLTASLNKAAQCWGLWANGRLAAFAGMLHRPHARTRNIKGCSRLVTLPDFQGLGLAFVLIDMVGAIYKAAGYLTHTYPAHPALIRSFDRSRVWALRHKPGTYGPSKVNHRVESSLSSNWATGTRPCAVFRYAGAAFSNKRKALSLIAEKP